MQFVINALYLIPALLVGLIGHEFSHAAVAVARGDETPWRLLLVAFYLNVALAVLNILPIPPLDGYNFFSTLFRRRLGAVFLWIDKYQQVIMLVFVLLLLLTGVLRFIYLPVATLILRLPPFPVGT